MTLINVAELVNPATGKTYREENNARVHAIPLNALVEVMKYDMDESVYVDNPHGLRLYVTRHGRDCDGTPLYYLSHMTIAEYNDICEFMKMCQLHGDVFKPRLAGGYPEECLKVVSLDPEIDDD